MGTRYRGTKREVKTLNAYIKLIRAVEGMESRLSRLRGEDGITSSQFFVLEALLHLGPMNQQTLAQKLRKSGSNMVMVIDNLEKNGLVERRRDNHDRRNVTVYLTGEGRRFIRTVFPRQLSAIMEEMNVLTDEELDELSRLCKKLGLKSTK